MLWIPDRALRVWALAVVIELWSWARSLTLTVPLTRKLNGKVNLRWTSISFIKSSCMGFLAQCIRNTLPCFGPRPIVKLRPFELWELVYFQCFQYFWLPSKFLISPAKNVGERNDVVSRRLTFQVNTTGWLCETRKSWDESEIIEAQALGEKHTKNSHFENKKNLHCTGYKPSWQALISTPTISSSSSYFLVFLRLYVLGTGVN